MPGVHEAVSFDLLVSHWYGSEKERAAFRDMHEKFEAQHGHLLDQFWCSELHGAIGITDRFEIFCCYPRVDAPEYDGLARRLQRCTSLATRARRMLSGAELRRSQETIFDMAKDGVDLLDDVRRRQSAGSDPLSHDTVEQALSRIDDGLNEAEAIYEHAAQRTAQFWYLAGVGVAALSLLGLSAVLATSSRILSLDLGPTPWIIAAGAAGAVLSVLSRVTNGKLVLEHEAGVPMLGLLGGVRPVVGAIAAAGVVVLVASGLLPLKVPAAPGDKAVFYAAIAFLSGFSERWAQDMLAAGQSQAATGGRPA